MRTQKDVGTILGKHARDHTESRLEELRREIEGTSTPAPDLCIVKTYQLPRQLSTLTGISADRTVCTTDSRQPSNRSSNHDHSVLPATPHIVALDLTDEDIRDLQAAHRAECDEDLSDVEAREMASRLLSLYQLHTSQPSTSPAQDAEPQDAVNSRSDP
jgi:hypothetical protein